MTKCLNPNCKNETINADCCSTKCAIIVIGNVLKNIYQAETEAGITTSVEPRTLNFIDKIIKQEPIPEG